MNNDFSQTPSFYNTQEVFKKFLGQTSYYLALQESLLKIVSALGAKDILELGFGTGQTTVTVAKNVPAVNITAVDMRKDMVAVAQNLALENGVSAKFLAGDMTAFVAGNLQKFDMIYLIYSFHHIVDPLENKIEFLTNCYKNMRKGAYLCIGETFISEKYAMDGSDKGILDFFAIRGAEGYASTFWKSLKSLSAADIAYAKEVANYCCQMEIDAGKLVTIRKDEYLVKRSWLSATANNIGFEMVLDMQVNTIGDAMVLLKKI